LRRASSALADSVLTRASRRRAMRSTYLPNDGDDGAPQRAGMEWRGGATIEHTRGWRQWRRERTRGFSRRAPHSRATGKRATAAERQTGSKQQIGSWRARRRGRSLRLPHMAQHTKGHPASADGRAAPVTDAES
jgi:hypothetical protein